MLVAERTIDVIKNWNEQVNGKLTKSAVGRVLSKDYGMGSAVTVSKYWNQYFGISENTENVVENVVENPIEKRPMKRLELPTKSETTEEVIATFEEILDKEPNYLANNKFSEITKVSLQLADISEKLKAMKELETRFKTLSQELAELVSL